jgi:lipoprotein-releasing system permease protein
MLPFRIALRYIFSKKSTNAINIISTISMVGMCFGAFALIVVLSVFNGFEDLALSLYNSFTPDIEIKAAKGKTFTDTPELYKKITAIEGVQTIARTLEENAYIEYNDKAQIGTIKGVDDVFGQISSVKDYIQVGDYLLRDSSLNYAIVGGNIAVNLNVNIDESISPLSLTIPRKGVKTAILPTDAFITGSVAPSGIFAIQQEYDSKYVLVSLDYLRELLGADTELSAYELKVNDYNKVDKVKDELKKALGNEFIIRNRYEQKESLYRIIKIERWAVFAILTFILIIVSFNIIGSLSMLVIEKKKDISILKAMGATPGLIRSIYLLEGVLTGGIGAIIGIFLGFLLCYLQIQFGFIKLGGGTFVVSAYPVLFNVSDFVLTFFTVLFISLLASYLPASRASTNAMEFK